MRVLATGFYFRNNLGDDIYPMLIQQNVNLDITFISVDDLQRPITHDAVLVGGGDLLNEYFHTKLSKILKKYKGPVIGISYGIPFPSMIQEKTLSYYTHMFTRNLEDIDNIRKVLGSNRCHFMPDLAFNLQAPLRSPTLTSDKPRCGVFMVQNMMRFDFFMRDMIELLSTVGKTHHIDFYLFNTSKNQSENDSIISFELSSRLPSYCSSKVWNSTFTYEKMLKHMSKLDVGVCMRFHSHIFSMVSGLPFMSISSTRKTRSLMIQACLTDYQYNVVLDACGTPISSNSSHMIYIWNSLLNNRPCAQDFVSRSRHRLDNSLIRSLLIEGVIEGNITNLSTGDRRKNITDFIVDEIKELKDDSRDGGILAGQIACYRAQQALQGNPYPDTPYVWGFSEQYIQAKASLTRITSMVDYLVGEYQNIVKDQSSVSILRNPFRGLMTSAMSLFASNDTNKKIYFDIDDYRSFRSVHRSGWWAVIEGLEKHIVPNGIYCDLYVDRTFLWCNSFNKYTGRIPYTHEWIGFIHHTYNTEYSDNNVVQLLNNKEFQQSLYTCRGIYVLSNYMASYLKSKLNVKVVNLVHPTEIVSLTFKNPRFNKLKLVAIGAWLRDPLGIYATESNIKKVILYGRDMNDYIPPDRLKVTYAISDINENKNSSWCMCPCRPNISNHRWMKSFIDWLLRKNIIIRGQYISDSNTLYIVDRNCDTLNEKENIIRKVISEYERMRDSVKVVTRLSNNEYDDLLSKCVVFLQLVDCSAVNTLMECVVRNTPLVVNKHPAVVEILGDLYPLYFDYKSDPQLTLTSSMITSASSYMSRLDKSKLSLNSFVTEFLDHV